MQRIMFLWDWHRIILSNPFHFIYRGIWVILCEILFRAPGEELTENM